MPKIVSVEERRIKRDIIIRAASFEFSQKGFHKTTMSSISKRANMAKGTIYLYFKDKESLYQKTIEECHVHFSNYVNKRIAGVKNPINKFEQIVLASWDFWEKEDELFNFFVQLEFFGDNKYPSELKDIISRIIEEGMDKGFIRKMDKKIAYNFYVNATAGFMKDNREEILNCDNESKIPKLKMLLKRRAETLLHLIIHGLTGMK